MQDLLSNPNAISYFMKCKLFLIVLALLPIVPVIAQTRQQTENLYTFARLYGYVRHFHPSDAAVVADWDNLAIYGAREAEKAANPKALQQTLEQLFKTIAPSLRIYPTGTPVSLPDLTPADTTGMKTVAWQHSGYGAGSNTQTYHSIRTNSYIKKRPSQDQGASFSTIVANIDAKPYQGRTIRYTAATKAISLTSGTGQLWLRVDRKDNKMGFFDNMDNRPLTGSNTGWRRDTIIGKIDDDAHNISFGCFISNKGSMLVDDIKVEIETPNGWEPIPVLNGDFEKDAPDANPDYWVFSKKDELFTVKTSSIAAADGKQSLFLERTVKEPGMQKTSTFFANTLPAGTVIKKDIGSGLSIVMPVALWGNGQQAYPFTDTALVTAQNNRIAAEIPTQFSGDNPYIRLAGIIITWNIFQHFHPYYKEWITDWDNDLRIALQACYEDKTADDFENTLKTLTAKLRDGHVYVVNPVSSRNKAFLPVNWEWIENNLTITQVLSADLPLQPGNVITSINGIPTGEYIKQAAKAVSAGSPNALMRVTLTTMIIGPKDSALQLTVAASGQNARQVNVPFTMEARQHYMAINQNNSAYRQIDRGTIYLNISQMPWTKIKTKLPELSDAKVVIIDLRGYPKGENGTQIVSHLLKQPDTDKWMHLQQITLPDHENIGWRGLGWNLKPARPHIGGKVFFLTNGDAISYAESVMGYIKDLKLATIIGEPTAGANGDVNRVTLPGGYTFSFTGLKVTNHNGSQHFMKGIQPDVPMQRTAKGILNNEDELLAKAIELSRQ